VLGQVVGRKQSTVIGFESGDDARKAGRRTEGCLIPTIQRVVCRRSEHSDSIVKPRCATGCSHSLENPNNSLRGLIARNCRGRVVLQSSMPKYQATYGERSVIHVSRALLRYTDLIGIGAAVTHRPLPHHRAYGSVHGNSSWVRCDHIDQCRKSE
jgi:hypothetical protein